MEMTDIAVGELKPAKDNPRTHKLEVDDLVASIKNVGILEPLIATKNGSGYIIVAGHRRYEAAKKAKLTTVPVIVKELTDAQRIEIMCVENLHREDLTVLEEANSYQRLMEAGKYSQRTMAERLGRSQAHISKRLSLLALPDSVLKKLDSGDMSIGDALELAKLKPEEVAVALKRPSWESIDQAVKRIMWERGFKAAWAKAEAEAKPHGWTVVDYKDFEAQEIGEKSWRSELKKIKLEDHKKLPCHCLIVQRDGSITHGCEAPDVHQGGSKEGRSAKDTRERDAIFAKAVQEKRSARREWLAEQVKGRVTATDRNAVLRAGLLTSVSAESCKLACRMLGLTVEKPDKGYVDVREPLRAYDGPVERLILALAAAAAEAGTMGGSNPWDSPNGQAYLDSLKQLGYRPSKEELKLVRGK